MSIDCPACGFDKNPANAEFCDACGSELVSPSAQNSVGATVDSVADSQAMLQAFEPVTASPETPQGLVPPPPTEPQIPQGLVPPPPDEPQIPVPDVTADKPIIPLPSFSPPEPPVAVPISNNAIGSSSIDQGIMTARLIAKQPGSPVPEFLLDGVSSVGIFDPDSGPVEVDLDGFYGHEMVSRRHAEIYPEGGGWKIKDIGSTNGVFIKPVGQSHFGARLQSPQTINSGDEVAIAKVRFLFQCP